MAPIPAAASIADSGEYLVAVGLFSSRDRADQVVEALTQAGLPAMERPFQLRVQQVQQIVIGPSSAALMPSRPCGACKRWAAMKTPG